jgi:signal transduction histidine kinase
VLINLLSNAIKYSPDGGNIQIQCIQEGLNVHISIQDEGIGIPDEALERIFEPYNRVQSPETRYIGGTGLGLSITQYIIELHGGTIRVESVLGQGTTFHILLPHLRQ